MPPSLDARPAATPRSAARATAISERGAGDTARPALLALLAYLTLAVAALALGRWTPAQGGLALAHLAGIVVVAALLRAGDDERASVIPHLRRWLPLLALPLLYMELGPVIAALHDGMRDTVVVRWETQLFGEPARTLATRFPRLALSEALHAGYLSYYPLIYLPPLALALRRRHVALGETMLALTIAFGLCFLVFLAFPVEGPRFRWGAATGAPSGAVRDLARALLEGGSSRGTAFPSSHVAVSVAQAALALRHGQRSAPVVVLCAVGVGVGAVYGGFHYAIDVLAGAVVGGVALVAAVRLFPVLARRR